MMPIMPTTCADDGLIVGTAYPIGDARRARAAGEMLGCGHLVCESCGAVVIHVDGVRLVRDMPTGAELHALRALPAADRAGSPLFTDAGMAERFRVYSCACFADETLGASPAVWVEVGWRCAGHP
jgi:hypothetical protein